MVSEQRRCPSCKRRFLVPRENRRVKCERCSPPRNRGKVLPEPEAPGRLGPGPVEAVFRAELERAGRHESWLGVLALRAARDLDDPRLTPAQSTAISREVERLMSKALAGVAPEPDFVDDLADRRRTVSG